MWFLAFLAGILAVFVAAGLYGWWTDWRASSSTQAPLSQFPHWQLFLPGNGQEVFAPEPLSANRVYRFTFTGTYRFRHWGIWYDADAAFYNPSLNNFTDRYPGVELDGVKYQGFEPVDWTLLLVACVPDLRDTNTARSLWGKPLRSKIEKTSRAWDCAETLTITENVLPALWHP